MRDVVGERTVQRWFNIEDDKEILEVVLQGTFQAMHPNGRDGEPMKEDQQDDNNTKNVILKSWPSCIYYGQLNQLEEIIYIRKYWGATYHLHVFRNALYKF